MSLRRRETYFRLVASKTVGFFGAVALIFNAATGPGLPFTPSNFQDPGWLFTIFSFVFFAFVSGFSILFIIEAMQSIPGNKHFQGDVEYATLINFYFEPVHHVVGQILLYGALQSNSIQGIVLSAQAIDRLIIDLFGKTCGLGTTGWNCVTKAGSLPSPFGTEFIFFSLGFLVVLLLVIPLGITDLDNNMWVQYVAFCISFLMALQWVSTAFISGLDSMRTPVAVSNPISYGSVIGTVMLNYAIITIIPSWINIKSKDVNVQKTVWFSILAVTVFYIVSGLLLAMGFDKDSQVDNILTTLIEMGRPTALTKLTVYLFAFIMLIPAIPVNLIISRENLFQNNLCSDSIIYSNSGVSFILAFIIPWLVAIPLQTGTHVLPFQIWTSLIFVSSSNFIIPVLIYFKCKVFRQKYNSDRELSNKQLDLLKKIHAKSYSLVKLIGRKKKAEKKPPALQTSPNNIPTHNDQHSIGIVVTTDQGEEKGRSNYKLNHTESEGTISNLWLNDDIPDPDAEDRLEESIHPELQSGITRLSRKLSSYGASATSNDLVNETREAFEAGPIQLQTIAGSLESLESTIDPRNSEIKPVDEVFADTSVVGISLGRPSNLHRVVRRQTLPTHPQFRTPAFRSVPRWMPFRGDHVGKFILVVTSIVTVVNVVLNIIPS